MRSLLIPGVLAVFFFEKESTQSDARQPPFETLEECQKAYDALLGTQQVSVTPKYAEKDAEPAAAAAAESDSAEPTEESATTTTTTTTKPPLEPQEVGDMKHHKAEITYNPPRNNGEMSESDGWDYGEHGDDWASHPDGAGCQGTGQSPVDIVRYVDIEGQTKSVLWFDYYADPRVPEVELHMSNMGHGVYVHQPDVDLGFIKLGSSEFTAYGYEFHAPSEHTIDGQVFPLELQIYHKDSQGHFLAVSQLFRYGESNDYLKALKNATAIPKWTVEKGGETANISGTNAAVFNLEHVLNKGSVHPGKDLTFYNYQGSMTQPPCVGGVSWWVSAEASEATQEEVAHVRDAIFGSRPTKRGNARSTQPLDGRKVSVGHTGFQHHIKQHGHKEKNILARGYNSQDAPWQ